VGLRVMLANGTSREIFDLDEVKAWRGSMGYLGLITAVELQMRKDNGILFGFREDFYGDAHPWNNVNFNNDFLDTTLNFDGCEWFYNPWQDRMQHFRVKYDANVSFNYASTLSIYQQLETKFPSNVL